MASKELFSLGKLYPSDFLKLDEEPRSEPIELKLIMEDDGFVHLEKTAPKDAMWGRYWYRSGINSSMTLALKDIVDSILPTMKFKENDVWCDVACNDGTLLSFVPDTFIKIGIDPADDSFKEESEKHADLIIQDYFSAEVYKKSHFGNQKIKVLTSIAVFYDMTEPKSFVKDVLDVLEDDGLWVMQLSYSPLMIHQKAFDNILHEHWAYYSLQTLQNVLSPYFNIIDCQLNDVNGGSMRVYIMKQSSDISKYGTQAFRDVCLMRVKSLLTNEGALGICKPEIWIQFFNTINDLKNEFMEFVINEKNKGKTFWGYGASTKGNTLIQFFGLNNHILDGIAERNVDKWGLRTIGSDIEIHPESTMRKAMPDYIIIFPWHFISEFTLREQDYLKRGGSLIVPCPIFKIIS